MKRMGLAELAVLLRLHSLRVGLLVLRQVIIPVLALGTLQRYSCSLACCHKFFPPSILTKIGQKKKTFLFPDLTISQA